MRDFFIKVGRKRVSIRQRKKKKKKLVDKKKKKKWKAPGVGLSHDCAARAAPTSFFFALRRPLRQTDAASERRRRRRRRATLLLSRAHACSLTTAKQIDKGKQKIGKKKQKKTFYKPLRLFAPDAGDRGGLPGARRRLAGEPPPVGLSRFC